MAELVGTLVLLGLIMAVEPLPVIGFILVLSTPRGRANGVAFVLGWVVTMAAIAAGVVALAGTWDPGGGGGRAELGAALQLAAGLVLLSLWLHRRRRPAPAAGPSPGWMRRVDRLRPGGAAVLGFLLQPWPLTAAGMGAILHAGLGAAASAVAAAVFVAVSASGLVAMLAYELAAPDRARSRLGALRAWLELHRSGAITFVAGVAGAWFTVAGLLGLLAA